MNKKQSRNKVLMIVISLLLLVAGMSLIFYLLHQPTEQTNNSKHKKSSLVVKNQPKEQINANNNLHQFTKKECSEQIEQAIPFTFKVMAETDAQSGVSLNLANLSTSDRRNVDRYYNNRQAMQDLNDMTNGSTTDGSFEYGDAGSGMHVKKRPKVGSLYHVNSLAITYYDADDQDYYFDVRLAYHPRGFKSNTIKLAIAVNKELGSIDSIKQADN